MWRHTDFRFLCSFKDPFERYYHCCGFAKESLPSAGRTLSVCFRKWCHTPTVPEEQPGRLPQHHWMVRFAGLMWCFLEVDSDWLLISLPALQRAPHFLSARLLKCHQMKRSSRPLFCWPVPVMSSHPLLPPSVSMIYWKLYRCGLSLCDDRNCWVLVLGLMLFSVVEAISSMSVSRLKTWLIWSLVKGCWCFSSGSSQDNAVTYNVCTEHGEDSCQALASQPWRAGTGSHPSAASCHQRRPAGKLTDAFR